MKRFLKYLALSFIFVLSLIPVSETKAAESSEEMLREMTEYQKNINFDEGQAEAILDALAAVDPVWIELLHQRGVRILFTDDTMNDVEEFAEIPPAPMNDGRSPEEIPGAYSLSHRLLYVQVGPEHPLEQSIATALHELGHAVDHMMSGNVASMGFSSLGEIERLIEKEKQAVFPLDAEAFILTGDNPVREGVPAGKGYLDQPEEYFAEFFSEYYLGGENKEHLRTHAPETFHLFENLETRYIVTAEDFELRNAT